MPNRARTSPGQEFGGAKGTRGPSLTPSPLSPGPAAASSPPRSPPLSPACPLRPSASSRSGCPRGWAVPRAPPSPPWRPPAKPPEPPETPAMISPSPSPRTLWGPRGTSRGSPLSPRGGDSPWTFGRDSGAGGGGIGGVKPSLGGAAPRFFLILSPSGSGDSGDSGDTERGDTERGRRATPRGCSSSRPLPILPGAPPKCRRVPSFELSAVAALCDTALSPRPRATRVSPSSGSGRRVPRGGSRAESTTPPAGGQGTAEGTAEGTGDRRGGGSPPPGFWGFFLFIIFAPIKSWGVSGCLREVFGVPGFVLDVPSLRGVAAAPRSRCRCPLLVSPRLGATSRGSLGDSGVTPAPVTPWGSALLPPALVTPQSLSGVSEQEPPKIGIWGGG